MIEWQPMETAPADATAILRWHVIWKCPVAVQRNGGRYPGYPAWVTATKDQTWPDEAFAPHWAPIPAGPGLS